MNFDSVKSTSKIQIICELCSFFQAHDFTYALLGQNFLFSGDISGDIDIVVESNNYLKIYSILLSFCEKKSLQLIQYFNHESTAIYFILSWIDKLSFRIYLHPDICSDYYRNGRRLLSADELLENRKFVNVNGYSKQGFYIPNSPKAFIYYLLKRIDKQSIDAEHTLYLSQQWHTDPEAAKKELQRFWPEESAKLIAESASTQNWQPVYDNLKKLQKDIHAAATYQIGDLWKESQRITRRIIQPTGLFVVFLGADGSGKSSVIEKILPNLAPAFRRKSRGHFRPFVGGRGENIEQEAVTNPHGQNPRSVLGSVLKMYYYFLDFVLGFLIKIKPALIRSTLVVFDRYYHDILVDPLRYRYGGPGWVIKLINGFIPKPDMFILLDAPPEMLQSRKQEVPFEETQRQVEAYRKLVHSMQNGVVVDATQPLEEVVRHVEAVIIDYLHERVKDRLKRYKV